MKRRRYQYGSLTKKNNRFSEDVWQFRFYETTPRLNRLRSKNGRGPLAWRRKPRSTFETFFTSFMSTHLGGN